MLQKGMSDRGNMKQNIIGMLAMILLVMPIAFAAGGTITDFSEWSCDSGCIANSTGIHLKSSSAVVSSNLLKMTDLANTKSFRWTAVPGLSVKAQYRDFENEVLVDTADPNLLAYWKLDGDYQTSDGGLDLFGNGYSSDNFTTGAFEGEQAAAFNSSSQYLGSEHSNDYRLGDEGSISAWIKIPEDTTCGSDRCEIVNTRYDTQESGYSFEYRPKNKFLRFSWGVTGEASQYEQHPAFRGEYSLNDGMWHFVGVTFDSNANEIKFYADGYLIGTATGSFSTITDQSSKMIIGAQQNEASYFFDGAIAHVAIYDDVRTESEMHNDYYGSFVGGNIPIIYFHDVESGEVTSGLNTSYAHFTDLMDWLSDVGYTSVTAEELRRWQEGQFTLPSRPINIQFDDGFDGVYDLAYPYMDARGFRGTIALMTSTVGDSGRMSYAQATDLRSNENWEIASHFHEHLDLFNISESQQRSQFETSVQQIQDNMGFNPNIFLTPFCHMNAAVALICDDYHDVCTGICHGVTGGYILLNKTADPTYEWRRLTFNNGTNIELAKRSIVGYDTYNYWDNGSVWNSIGSLNDNPQYFQFKLTLEGTSGDTLSSISFSSKEAVYIPLPPTSTNSTSSSSEQSVEKVSNYLFLLAFGIFTLALVIIALIYKRHAA